MKIFGGWSLLSRLVPVGILLASVAVSALAETPASEQESVSGAVSDTEPAPPSTQANWSGRSYLSGDWGGIRSSLDDKGVDVDFRYTSFYQGLSSGTGEDDFEYGGKFDLFIDLDSDKMGLWQGGSFNAHVEYSHGDLQTNLGGTLFATNTALYFPVGMPEEVVATSLNYTQKVGAKTSISIGKFNPVDVYATHPFHGGWGIDRLMNIVPVAPPSGLIPVVFMGMLTNVETEPVNWTIIISDPNDRTSDYVPGDLFEDGVLAAVNATHFTTFAGRKTSFGITGLYSTADGVDYSSIGGGFVETSNKSGAYNVNIQFRHDLQQGGDQVKEAWGFFFKAGIADGNPNYVKSSLITGFGGRALFLGRPQDSFGLSAYYYNLSDVLEDSINPAAILGDEAAIEFFYNYSITPWLYLGLDIQYVKPARERFDNALVMGLRMQVRF